MASEKEMENDPNFAIICSFLHSYGHMLQFPNISIKALKIFLKSSHNKVHRILEDIFIRLLRRWKGRCPVDSWEKVLITFCYTYSDMDAWELEKFGFPRCSIHTKMRMLKSLLEVQFDCYNKFKEKINEEAAENLRLKPIGRDKNGLAYWLFLDKDLNIRVYTEEQDDTDESQSWQMIVKDKKGVVSLIDMLQDLKDLSPTEPTSSACSAAATPIPQELIQVCEDAKKCYGDSDKENTQVTENNEKVQDIDQKTSNIIKTEEQIELCPQSKNSHLNNDVKHENAKINTNNEKDYMNKVNSEIVEENNVLSVKVEAVKIEAVEKEKMVETETRAKFEDLSKLEKVNNCDNRIAQSNELQNNHETVAVVKPDICVKQENILEGDPTSENQVNTLEKEDKHEDSTDNKTENTSCDEKQQKELILKETDNKTENTSCDEKQQKELILKETDNKTENTSCDEKQQKELILKETESSIPANSVSEGSIKSHKVLTQRKRKRGKVESDSEQEGTENRCVKTTGKSESELSETPVQSSNESKDECSPTKRRRDKFLKKRKPVKANVSESTDESEEPEKKAKTTQKNTKSESSNSTDDSATTVTNKKSAKRKEGEEDQVDKVKEAPTSKKGRRSSKCRTQEETRETDIIQEPVMSLRRSSRVTRSVARLEYTAITSPSRKKLEKLDEKNAAKVESKIAKMERKDRKDKKSKKSNNVVDVNAVKSIQKKRGRPKLDDSNDEDDEDDEDIFHEEEDSEPLHWSSPSATEYEFDSDGEEFQPVGKNARRQEARKIKKEHDSTVEEENDTLCNKCANSDNPDLILLCDVCDAGYHTGCLRPPLMLIPLEDWFCPPCEHVKLIESLQAKLKEMDSVSRGNDRLERRKERLKFVGISLDNILHDNNHKKKAVIRSDSGSDSSEDHAEAYDNGEWETLKDKEQREKTNRQKDIRQKYYYDWGNKYIEEAQSSSVETDSESSSEEQYSMVVNRSRRQRKEINYNFSEYDQIISKAIHDGEDVPAGTGGKSMKNIVVLNNRKKYSDEESTEEEEEEEEEETGKGRGKDMANIEAALAKEEREKQKADREEQELTKDSVDIYSNKPSPPMQKVKANRKRGKRLTVLSDEEEYEDETDEYKASDDEVQSDENYSEEISDESYEYNGRRHSSKKSLRRSTRRRRVLRDMSDFVVEDYDSEEEHKEVRRSQRNTRSCKSKRVNRTFSEEDEEEVDSEYYSDDSIVAKKAAKRSSKVTKSLSKKKRKIGFSEESEDLSELEENIRRKKSTTHYEDDSDFNPSEEDGPKSRRRATSKRINYREVVGSESDMDSPKKKKKSKIDLNKFIKDEDSNTDEYSPDQGSNNEQGSETEDVNRTKKSRIRYVSNSSDSDNAKILESEHPIPRLDKSSQKDSNPVSVQPTTFLFKPKINGKTQAENKVLELPVKDVANVLQAKHAKEERSAPKKEADDSDDDLEGIGDIIDYITNE